MIVSSKPAVEEEHFPVKRRVFLQAAAAGVAAPILVPHHVLAAPGQPGARRGEGGALIR